jgi:hypothetical protein
MGDHSVSATYRASPRYRGVWAAFCAASPGSGPVGGIPRRGGPRLLLKERCRPGTWTAIHAALPGSPPVGGVLGGLGPRLGVKESRRCLAPHRPGWVLLAGYCPWEVSPPDGGGLVPGADPALVLPVGGLASWWRRPGRRCRSSSRRRNIYLNVNCGIQFLYEYEDMYI